MNIGLILNGYKHTDIWNAILLENYLLFISLLFILCILIIGKTIVQFSL